jgi:hypothetical protein
MQSRESAPVFNASRVQGKIGGRESEAELAVAGTCEQSIKRHRRWALNREERKWPNCIIHFAGAINFRWPE